MKQPNEKKQDLLLDALSCIDEDILEQGLALRDGKAATGSRVPSEAYLFDLSELNRKTSKKAYWRGILVATAMVVLLAAVPLSALLVTNRKNKESPEAVPPYEETLRDPSDSAAGAPGADISPDPSTEKADDWEDIRPGEPMETAAEEDRESTHPEEVTRVPGVEENTELGWPETDEVPGITYPETSSQLLWIVLDRTNGFYGFRATSHAGRELELIGTVQGKVSDQVLSPEDEMVLKLIGQWMLSVYTLDYEIHFSLFPDEVIAERILPAFEEAGLTYEEALERIHRTASETYGLESLNLSFHLISNELITGSNLEEYRRQFAEYHPDSVNAERITAVRKIRFSEENQVIVGGRFWVDPLDVTTEFYAYEYEGQWYLDTASVLEDDLCIDLLQSDSDSSPFYQSLTCRGTVTALDHEYLYLNGLAFQIRNVTLPDGLQVGDTVTVTYHGLGVTFLMEESDGLIQTPNKVASLYILDSVTIADP